LAARFWVGIAPTFPTFGWPGQKVGHPNYHPTSFGAALACSALIAIDNTTLEIG
jgi:hypothetical protein